MINSSLDKRLLSCADYVRAGAVFADIGTDHGYLPIFLLKAGKIERAVLSDINEGPLGSARRNAEDAGVTDRCTFVLTDGARALSHMGITDYVIAGMGGELIASIIEHAPALYDKNVRLILQPMTRQAALRKFLALNGFAVIDECYSASQGKHYVTIAAEYTGEKREISDIDAELGIDITHTHDRADFFAYFELKLLSLRRALIGKEQGMADASFERELMDAIKKRLASCNLNQRLSETEAIK